MLQARLDACRVEPGPMGGDTPAVRSRRSDHPIPISNLEWPEHTRITVKTTRALRHKLASDWSVAPHD